MGHQPAVLNVFCDNVFVVSIKRTTVEKWGHIQRITISHPSNRQMHEEEEELKNGLRM